jgi:murein DD-endopeptidase MepM/ murein hydrolase activator NlpD
MIRVLFIFIFVAFIAALAYLLLPQLQISAPTPQVDIVSHVEEKDTVEVKAPPKMLYGMVIDSMLVIEDKIKRNQSLSDILSAYNVSYQTIYRLSEVAKDIFDVRKIAANKKYTLICTPDSLTSAKAFVYEASPVDYVVFHLKDSLSVEVKQKEVRRVEKSIAGVIEYSLAETMDALGVTPQLTNNFVDVFAWQLDFQHLQKGDRFKLIYEDIMIGNESVGVGDIKAIYFRHFDNDYYAFQYDQGDGFNYYDEEGKSLRKALLKYPIEFTRISSRYSRNRFHPVQKRWKPHLGTDFAAPRGTPIRSVGDGIVLEAQYKGYNGNYVKIKHNSTYTTQYLHMHKIASGIRPGTRVKQGDVIGFVGSTGLATGNHLCYRFWKNGVQVDALAVELPPSDPIKEEEWNAFEAVRNSLIGQLNEITYPDDPPVLFVQSF